MDGRADSRRDRSGICICLAVIGIILLYADQVREKEWISVSAGVGLILFIFLVLRDGKRYQPLADTPCRLGQGDCFLSE